jgi:hypothetical protein
MPFQSVTRTSLELLNQNYRSPGVAPRPLPPGRGDAAAPDNPDFKVVDEFIRVLPFINADAGGRPHARQYKVRTAAELSEPNFTARPAGTPWAPGVSTGWGQELEFIGARFKKLSTVVRSDEGMVDHGAEDMLTVQAQLAEVALVRAVSEAIFHSVPASDDNAELLGLPFYAPAGSPQNVAYDPARKLIGGLSEIEARCAPSDGDHGAGPTVFVVTSRSRWRLCKELEDKGVTPDYRYSALTGRLQLHFHGIPVLTGRLPEPAATAPATPTTDAWALNLLGPTGVRMIHLGGESTSFGVRQEMTNTLATVDATGEAHTATRALEVFGVYSLQVPEPQSVARLTGILTKDPFTAP